MTTPKPPAPVTLEVRLPLPRPQNPEIERALEEAEAQIFRAGFAHGDAAGFARGRASQAAETNAQLAREVARLKQARKP